jgi:hypothetical protein
MINKGFVWVQRDPITFHVTRIFKSKRAAFAAGGKTPTQSPRVYAVASIRHQLFVRSEGLCEKCCAIVTESSGHMHEQKWRGKGGEISLENSLFICARCHQHEHKERAPQFTRRKP